MTQRPPAKLYCPQCKGTKGFYYWAKVRWRAQWGRAAHDAKEPHHHPITVTCSECNYRTFRRIAENTERLEERQ